MIQGLLNRFLQGDAVAAGKLITLVENKNPGSWQIMHLISQHTGNAYVIGITGPPGAGKSTIVDKLIDMLRKQNITIGVVCVDPTSPYTGGAFLGDRIRMQKATMNDDDVFVRSMANRGELGGLAPRTKEVIQILDAFGKDVIIVETVGAGQIEADIINTADTTVVVTVPGLGDQMQALKAGILEIADLLVVNKADRDGAEDAVRDLNVMLDLMPKDRWRPKVLTTIGYKNEGIKEMLDAIFEHKNYLLNRGSWLEQRRKRREALCFSILEESIKDYIFKEIKEYERLEAMIEKVREGLLDPYSVVESIFNELLNKEIKSFVPV